MRAMVLRAIFVLIASGFIAGCASLLPRSESATQDGWKDYESARAAIESILPGQSRRTDLAATGINPYTNASVAILSFSEIAQRFALGAGISAEDLDAGVRRCLTAGKGCTGYAIAVRRTSRTRIGNFWLDSLNFVRDVDVMGWSFNALVLFVDDTVVYTLTSGQPRIHEREVSRNPLGPLQGAGEAAASRVLR